MSDPRGSVIDIPLDTLTNNSHSLPISYPHDEPPPPYVPPQPSATRRAWNNDQDTSRIHEPPPPYTSRPQSLFFGRNSNSVGNALPSSGTMYNNLDINRIPTLYPNRVSIRITHI